MIAIWWQRVVNIRLWSKQEGAKEISLQKRKRKYPVLAQSSIWIGSLCFQFQHWLFSPSNFLCVCLSSGSSSHSFALTVFGSDRIRNKPSAWISISLPPFLHHSFIFFFLVLCLFKTTSSTSVHSLATSILLGLPSIIVLIQNDYCQKFTLCATSGLAGHQASAPAAGIESGCW